MGFLKRYNNFRLKFIPHYQMQFSILSKIPLLVDYPYAWDTVGVFETYVEPTERFLFSKTGQRKVVTSVIN